MLISDGLCGMVGAGIEMARIVSVTRDPNPDIVHFHLDRPVALTVAPEWAGTLGIRLVDLFNLSQFPSGVRLANDGLSIAARFDALEEAAGFYTWSVASQSTDITPMLAVGQSGPIPEQPYTGLDAVEVHGPGLCAFYFNRDVNWTYGAASDPNVAYFDYALQDWLPATFVEEYYEAIVTFGGALGTPDGIRLGPGAPSIVEAADPAYPLGYPVQLGPYDLL